MRRKNNGTGLVANEEGLLDVLLEHDGTLAMPATADLMRTVAERVTAGTWHSNRLVNEATLYRILQRFAARGWLTARWDVPTDVWAKGYPVRRFRLTPAGRTAARRLRNERGQVAA